MPLEAIAVQQPLYFNFTPVLAWLVAIAAIMVLAVKNHRHRRKWHDAENSVDRLREQYADKIKRAQEQIEEISAAPAKVVTVKSYAPTDAEYLTFIWKLRNAPQWQFFIEDLKQSLYQGVVMADSQALVDNVAGKIKGLRCVEQAIDKMCQNYQRLSNEPEAV